MDTPENQPSPTPTPTPSQPSRDELQAQLDSLAGLLNSVLILIFVLAGATDYYLFRQSKIAHDEVVAARQYVGQLGRNSAAIDEFVHKLAAYGQTHPDFAPIYNKYGLKNLPAASPAPAAGIPAPATNKAKK